MAKRSLRRYKAAITDYGETILRMPEYAEAYVERGMIQRRLEHNTKARADFETALKLSRDTGDHKLEVKLVAEIQEIDELEWEKRADA